MAKTYEFTVTGFIEVPDHAEEVLAYDGEVIGFSFPDSPEVYRALFALEYEADTVYEVLHSGKELRAHGFEVTDYDVTNFRRQKVFLDCPVCNGRGWRSGSEMGHAPDCTGDCLHCPEEIEVQVDCDMCGGSGKIGEL
jgi:hypothetical protein